MTSRIDLELTSTREDGVWTWRAAGAKKPKGELAAALLPDGAKVGDVLRADAEFEIEGIEVVKVYPPKSARSGPELLEILGSGTEQPLVTTQLVKGSKGGRGERRGGGRGRDRDGRGGGYGGGRDGGRGGRDGGRGGRDGARGGRDRDSKPRPQRLRPQRVHRDAWLASVSDEHRPIAEQLMAGGIPAVRDALKRQNEQAAAEGKPEISDTAIVSLAEGMMPAFTAADWRDRADAAMAGSNDVDLRDLRSVVGAAEAGARDEESRAIADKLRAKVNARVDAEHATWLSGLNKALTEDRVVRALRQSARPVKLGTPLPDDVVSRLVEAANQALDSDSEPERWATVLDAVAFSPVQKLVVPTGKPDEDDPELLKTVKKLSSRVPQIAALFGIEPSEDRSRKRGSGGGKRKGKAEKPTADKPDAKADAPAETPEAEAPAAEAPAAEAPAAEAPAAEAPAAEAPASE